MDFEKAYNSLNQAQKEAVNTIDGPIMVVAGPGTGKTQLLATRVANILKKDSTLLPTNILCLTFTDSGQVAMQRRLIELMGETGAHVAVHTFHSFGTEIINSHPEYFYQGSNFSPADELTTHEILAQILEDLPYRNPLRANNMGEYIFLNDIKKRLEELKKSAVSPEELKLLAIDGIKFVDFLEAELFNLFDVPRFTKKTDIDRAEELLKHACSFPQDSLTVKGFKPLSEVFIETFGEALHQAQEISGTKPLNIWKTDWYKRGDDKENVCIQRNELDKLLSLAEIYEKYQIVLHERKLFDFDDMIVKVVHALETRPSLAYDLQEQYQYFLVDEFQDTNAGQLRLLHALANHPVNENRPNVLVVGDDDQAIYAFQGAELSNILGFKESYTDVKLITLTENYRSNKNILDLSRAVIVQGIDRLENRIPELEKTLHAAKEVNPSKIERHVLRTQVHEYEWVASRIKELISQGHEANEIAVICRQHKYLEALLPYFYDLNVPISYEHRQDALANPQIKQLIVLARVVEALSREDDVTANGLLPELLSADYWQIPAQDIWKLSMQVRQKIQEERRDVFWLEIMLSDKCSPKIKTIANFLLQSAKQARTDGLEQVLDILIGNTDSKAPDEPYEDYEQPNVHKKTSNSYVSPFKNFYFGPQILDKQPEAYIELLGCLSALRNHLRQYRADIHLNLTDFINFIDLSQQAKITISAYNLQTFGDESVQLLTAHKSKGLEFKTVFLLSAVKDVWMKNQRGSRISLPPNLLSIAHSQHEDDNLRLLYVTMTRAKNNLIISGYLKDSSGKETVGIGALEASEVQQLLPTPKENTEMPDSADSNLKRAELLWFDKHWQLPHKTIHELLQPKLETYKLSVTHLNNFLDVTHGGPRNFLLNNLLQFPTAMGPGAAFGSAMHETMQFIHETFISNKSLPDLKQIQQYFKSSLMLKRMNAADEKHFLDRGHEALSAIVNNRKKYFKINQLPEQNFFGQGVTLGDAKLTGKIDVLEINKSTAHVIDYKTGKTLKSWNTFHKTPYEQIKLHQYAQQLYFYKILVEGSRSWGDKGVKLNQAELVFVEPDKQETDIISLGLELTDEAKIQRLNNLIEAVWQRIVNLDFIDTGEYEPTLKGIKTFEDWLIDNKK